MNDIQALKKENEELKAKLVKVEVFEINQEIEKIKKEIEKKKDKIASLTEKVKTIKAENPNVFPKSNRGRKPKEN